MLQEWYEEHWNDAEDVTPEMLRVIERHMREYTPFEVYAKALQEFFRGHEMTASEWEQSDRPCSRSSTSTRRKAITRCSRSRTYTAAHSCATAWAWARRSSA